VSGRDRHSKPVGAARGGADRRPPRPQALVAADGSEQRAAAARRSAQRPGNAASLQRPPGECERSSRYSVSQFSVLSSCSRVSPGSDLMRRDYWSIMPGTMIRRLDGSAHPRASFLAHGADRCAAQRGALIPSGGDGGKACSAIRR